MDAIKKKMTAMKLEKDAAYVKAEQLEVKVAEQKTLNEQVWPTAWINYFNIDSNIDAFIHSVSGDDYQWGWLSVGMIISGGDGRWCQPFLGMFLSFA